MRGYDYIVAGAGTAGCVLAARLSQDPAARVLLLEAGSADRPRAMTVPAAWPENLGSAADWADQTTSQADAGPVSYPRGRTLGGSGAINAMAHIRGHRSGYDGWAELRSYIRRGVGSYWHPVGTCRIGRDDAAVVDSELRVHGLTGLRVADASVMPTIPNAHPNATVLAIAERAADLIHPA